MKTNMNISFGAALNLLLPDHAHPRRLGQFDPNSPFGEHRMITQEGEPLIMNWIGCHVNTDTDILSGDEYKKSDANIIKYNKENEQGIKEKPMFHEMQIWFKYIADEIKAYMKEYKIGEPLGEARRLDLTEYKGNTIGLVKRLAYAKDGNEVVGILKKETEEGRLPKSANPDLV